MKCADGWPEDELEILKNIGNDNFHIVPIRTIGFRPCVPRVPFKEHGKIVLQDPNAPEDYVGYWYDRNTSEHLKEQPERLNMYHEYYYYLNPNYDDA